MRCNCIVSGIVFIIMGTLAGCAGVKQRSSLQQEVKVSPCGSERWQMDLASRPYDMVSLDYNIDGDVDLAVLLSDEEHILLLSNTRRRFFLANGRYSCKRTDHAIRTVDIDTDGDEDLLLSGSAVMVRPNDGYGGFDEEIFIAEDGAAGLCIADVIGDGHPEVIVFRRNTDEILVIRNPAVSGQHTHPVMLLGSVAFVTSCDMDADGTNEVIGAQSGSIGIVSFVGAGFEALGRWEGVEGTMKGVSCGDFDGDGTAEIVVLDHDGQAIAFLEWEGSALRLVELVQLDMDASAIFSAEVDGSPALDLVVLSRLERSVVVVCGSSSRGLVPTQPIPLAGEPLAASVDDFDMDGKQDLAVATVDPSQVVVLWGNRLNE
jgi:hypothetical protein